jgi:hypothetical protein
VIRTCTGDDFETIYTIINDAAQAYRGVIPADCWHEPYMSRDALARAIEAGVSFFGFDRYRNAGSVRVCSACRM